MATDPVAQMTTDPLAGGYVTYPPQTQLPAAATVVVVNPPQSLPQTTAGPLDQFTRPTAYRPPTAPMAGTTSPAVSPPTMPAAGRYAPSIVAPSGTPGAVGGSGVGTITDAPDPNMPHDPTEAGAR